METSDVQLQGEGHAGCNGQRHGLAAGRGVLQALCLAVGNPAAVALCAL